MAKASITQDRLKEVLHYNPETGIFTWIKFLNSRAPIGSEAGYINGQGYRWIRIDKKMYAAHRLAYLYKTGQFPSKEIDHINHIRADNRWINLRPATRKQNGRNTCLSSHNSSGIHGVHWCNSTLLWRARIKVSQKTIYILGTKDFFEACCARKSAEIKYGFHPNHGSHVTTG